MRLSLVTGLLLLVAVLPALTRRLAGVPRSRCGWPWRTR